MKVLPIELNFALVAIAAFVGITAAVALFLAIAAVFRRATDRRILRYRTLITGRGFDEVTDRELKRFVARRPFSFLSAYRQSFSHVSLPDRRKKRIETIMLESRVDIMLIREINKRSRFRRMRAATYLAYVPSAASATILDIALRKERIAAIRLRIIYAIVRQRYVQVIPTVIDTLRDSDEDYRERVTGLLLDLGYEIVSLLPLVYQRKEPEIQKLFIEVARNYPQDDTRRYLETVVDNCSPPISHDAFRVLMKHYGRSVDPTQYLASHDPVFVNLAIDAMGDLPSDQSIDTIIPFLSMDTARESAIIALSRLIETTPRYLPYMIDRFRDETDRVIQTGLAEVLSIRAEYVCERVIRDEEPRSHRMLSMLVMSKKASGILTFLNRNTDRTTEAEICRRIGGAVREDPWLREEYQIYAKDSVIDRLGLDRRDVSTRRGKRHGENPAGVAVGLIIAASITVPIVLFLGLQFAGGSSDFMTVLQTFHIDYMIWFENSFALYAIVLNSIYLVLLIAAVLAVVDSTRLWDLRPIEFLFTPRILPAVSILAPAFNEQETIVESVRALLNLNYPEYEVIVINDGSVDETLERLVETFQLERTRISINTELGTRPIRGVYRNPRIPELVVIDKSNGGKADSLNAGINAARFPFYAAIDADSLLERDALLHLAAETLDSELPVTATGGNIMPINGCRVERGAIDEVRFPRHPLAQFQMVEYVRAFMTGRTGWAQLQSLLIISGAFGLFRRRDVVEARGYLTSSERLLKDTVAEDMELVVRLTRRLKESGAKGTIRYAPGANCWTEVPESMSILASQRDRWQRGLVDVLFYHRKIALRRRYGTAGLIAMPYFYIFELVGPWIEIQALILLIVGLATGILPLYIAAIVFTATIGLGVLTSMLSMQLAEWKQPIFKRFDKIFVLIYAIAENFGYRQFSNLLRLSGYISIIRKKSGWGTMRRRGFSVKKG